MGTKTLEIEISCVDAMSQFDHRSGQFDGRVRKILNVEQIGQFINQHIKITCQACGLIIEMYVSQTPKGGKLVACGDCKRKGQPHMHGIANLSGNLHAAMLLSALSKLVSAIS